MLRPPYRVQVSLGIHLVDAVDVQIAVADAGAIDVVLGYLHTPTIGIDRRKVPLVELHIQLNRLRCAKPGPPREVLVEIKSDKEYRLWRRPVA